MFYAFAISIVPIIAVLLCFILLVKEMNVLRGIFSCLLGLIALIPIEIILIFASKLAIFSSISQGAILLRCFVLNGIVEEGIKMAVLALLPAKKMSAREFLCCSILCGFSLGCFETLLYLINGQNIVLRLFTAVVVHTACAVLGGLFVFCSRKNQIPFLAPIFAVLTHTVYNYFAGFAPPVQYFSFAVILFAILECRTQYQGVKSMEKSEGNDEISSAKEKSVLSLFSGFFQKNKKNQIETKIESKTEESGSLQQLNQGEQSQRIIKSKEVSLDDFTTAPFVGVNTDDGFKDYAQGLPKIDDLFKDDLESPTFERESKENAPKPQKKRASAKKSTSTDSETAEKKPKQRRTKTVDAQTDEAQKTPTERKKRNSAKNL